MTFDCKEGLRVGKLRFCKLDSVSSYRVWRLTAFWSSPWVSKVKHDSSLEASRLFTSLRWKSLFCSTVFALSWMWVLLLFMFNIARKIEKFNPGLMIIVISIISEHRDDDKKDVEVLFSERKKVTKHHFLSRSSLTWHRSVQMCQCNCAKKSTRSVSLQHISEIREVKVKNGWGN